MEDMVKYREQQQDTVTRTTLTEEISSLSREHSERDQPGLCSNSAGSVGIRSNDVKIILDNSRAMGQTFYPVEEHAIDKQLP